MKARIAVLASGGGTNLQALLDYLDVLGEKRAGDVVVVASDRRDAGALRRAADHDVRTALVQTPGSRDGAEPLEAILQDHEIDVVALAGYLRLVPADIVAQYRGRIVNVHPALLPAFGGPGMYGIRVHQAVLASGAMVTGVTVHFVDQAYDRGPIIAQWPVPVMVGDTAASLAARVLRVEHTLYPIAVDTVAARRVTLDPAGSVHWRVDPGDASAADDWAFCLSAAASSRLAADIARLMRS
jgi:formyltetrahydrofolate-dependent phosphoribosylglycinamide formyltransferase